MKYDIAIIGGGMVGAAFACALDDTPLHVALVDAAASHASDHRLIALNYASVEFFKKLAIWPKLSAHASAIHEVHVSNRGHFGTTRLSAAEMNLTELGCVVPAYEINNALYSKLDELKNITLLRNTKLTALAEQNTHIDLTLQVAAEQKNIEASIVIGADGTFSSVRELLHIPAEIIDYQQKALVTITELQRAHHHIAYERFLPTGAIAMLPLTGHRVATIWSDHQDKIDELLKLSDENFLEQLQKNFGYRLGKLIKTQQRFCYPLKFMKAKEQIKDRVILIGNAAHTVSPIAAQGLNLALYEVDIITHHLRQSFTLKNLPDYFTQQNISINLSHRLTELFSMDFFGLNTAKQLGMIGFDFFSSIKKRVGKRILGMQKPMG